METQSITFSQQVVSCFIVPVPLSSRVRSSELCRRRKCPLVCSIGKPTGNQSVLLQESSPHHTPPPVAIDISTQSRTLLEWPLITEYVLRYASTNQGRRALAGPSGLHIPETQQQSELLLSHTRAAYYLEYILLKPLDFGGVSDVSETVDLVAKGRILTGGQLINIANNLQAARRIRRHIDSVPDNAVDKVQALSDLVSSLRTWPDVESEIRSYLDDFGDVQDSADPELREIRRSLGETASDIRATLNDLMSRHSDAVQDRVITFRYDRFVIPVKMSHKAVFRRGIVHDASSTGNTAYLEPASVKPLNDRIRRLTAQERDRVNAILKKLSLTFVAPIANDIRNLNHLLGELDATTARARSSNSLDATDVVFDNTQPLRLLGVRHPVLSWRAMPDKALTKEMTEESPSTSPDGQHALKLEPAWKREVIPSDYILSNDIRCVCVTGPNTGGKTLVLKTIGAAVLMAKAGLYVPCTFPSLPGRTQNMAWDQDESEDPRVARIPFFDLVLADIGDDQSVVQSLSTFSGHVERIKKILAASTSKSLVLLDEIGSGTDPAEGAALGMAVLRHLAIEQQSALTFATTHHGELKTLKYATDDSARFFENASVEFDDENMAPTYRLIWGIPGRSNAIAIAERLGLKREILEEARHLMTGSGESDDGRTRVDIEKMISSLERDKVAANSARIESEQALLEIQAAKAELHGRLEKLRKSEVDLRKAQKVTMEAEVVEAQKKIARVIKEMQREGGSTKAAAKATEKLRSMPFPRSAGSEDSQSESRLSPIKNPNELKVGDRVVVTGLAANEVEIVELVSKKEVVVAMGAMKVKVKLNEIMDVSSGAPSTGSSKRQRTKTAPERKQLSVRTAANTIDIRGERVDGAEAKVDRALDKALALGSLWIIHGHGTGRLKSGIRSFLSKHSLVERIEDAEQQDGGTGVTIAYLS